MRFSMPYFPAGAAGTGLVLLRVSLTHWLLIIVPFGSAPLWQQLGLPVALLGLLSGYQTRLLAVLCLVIGIERLFEMSYTYAGGPGIFSAMALALLGPGAFSLDARLFGRRTVTLS